MRGMVSGGQLFGADSTRRRTPRRRNRTETGEQSRREKYYVIRSKDPGKSIDPMKNCFEQKTKHPTVILIISRCLQSSFNEIADSPPLNERQNRLTRAETLLNNSERKRERGTKGRRGERERERERERKKDEAKM
jgi:hypothetical protein